MHDYFAKLCYLCYSKLGDQMRYIKQTYTNELIVNKSVFIILIYPLTDLGDIKTHLADAQIKHPKANHFCSAWIFGPTAKQQNSNDDGEPFRTAGVPMLEVLKHHNVTNILCIVIRYFGGIKLGASGLVRAYTKAVSLLIKQVTFYKQLVVSSYEISFTYNKINQIDHYLKEVATIIKKEYLENVSYCIVFIKDDCSVLEQLKYLLISSRQLPDHIRWTKEENQPRSH